MSKIPKTLVILAGAGILILVGIVLVSLSRSGSSPEPTQTVADPGVVLTAAAQTASARLTQIAATTPTKLPATATFTPIPTTATVAPTTPAVLPTTPSSLPSGDKADFVADVTVPDGTNFQPNQQFTKTWRLLNSGSTTWTTAFKLTFVQGDQMGGPTSVALTSDVTPGRTVEVSVPLIAPTAAGNYTGFWKMANAAGQVFESAVYVQIVVGAGPTSTVTATTGTAAATSAATATATSGPTTAPSETPTATTEVGEVTSAVLTVDQANFAGTCPHTFLFTAQVILNAPATVTYQLEAETTATTTLPGPATTPMNAGVNVLSYPISMSETQTGTILLHVTAPNNGFSNQVNFSLTCQ